MPVTPKDMSVDAKLRCWVSGEADKSAATAVSNDLPLYHASRDIIIESAILEVTELHATAAGAYGLGKTGTANYFATATTPSATSADGVLVVATIVRRRIPAGTACYINHTQGTGNGKGRFLIHYYYDQTKSDIESPNGSSD